MVDTQDVHTLRYEREALLKENPQVDQYEVRGSCSLLQTSHKSHAFTPIMLLPQDVGQAESMSD
jgi:hypothetical protein